MIRKHVFRDKPDFHSIRWRLHEPTRLEAFSDAVIAFAVTLVVISLEVPKNFDELLVLMHGFIGFAICFLFLGLIWYDQYVFFRRFGLQDTRTTFYNLFLLFMVIYLVFPLKFLFYSLSLAITGSTAGNNPNLSGFENEHQVCQLMIIYGVGYFIVYVIMTLMYAHALKRKDDLMLSPLEIYNTKTHMMNFMSRLLVVAISLFFAVCGLKHGPGYASYSGMSYSLTGIGIWLVYGIRDSKVKKKFSQKEIDELKNDMLMISE